MIGCGRGMHAFLLHGKYLQPGVLKNRALGFIFTLDNGWVNFHLKLTSTASTSKGWAISSFISRRLLFLLSVDIFNHL